MKILSALCRKNENNWFEPMCIPKNKAIECQICFHNVCLKELKYIGSCGHTCCKHCFIRYGCSKIKDISQYPITCLFCKHIIERQIWEKTLSKVNKET